MSHKLIDRNDDLRRLRAEGYDIEIHAGYLVARDIPYVNQRREVARGILVSSLDLNGEVTIRPSDHTMKFVGDYPCTSEGHPIEAIRHATQAFPLNERLTAQHSFSSKPPRGYYENYYEKVQTYAAILSGHAARIDPTADPKTFRVVEPQNEDSPFNYIDTASARVDINMITRKLAVERLAIVGLGGTGSYVLDLLAKTPAKEIHLFDGDKFSSHNAFRAPGAASKEALQKQPFKVEYFKEIYASMHKGIIAHAENIDAGNVEQLRGMACVFLCIGAGEGKRFIVGKLEEFGGLFIDTGIGLYATDDTLGGKVRVTTSEPANRDAARAQMSFAENDADNEYDKNIQTADLNALNATHAVLRWKKLRGFYFDHTFERSSIYTIGINTLSSDNIHEPS